MRTATEEIARIFRSRCVDLSQRRRSVSQFRPRAPREHGAELVVGWWGAPLGRRHPGEPHGLHRRPAPRPQTATASMWGCDTIGLEVRQNQVGRGAGRAKERQGAAEHHAIRPRKNGRKGASIAGSGGISVLAAPRAGPQASGPPPPTWCQHPPPAPMRLPPSAALVCPMLTARTIGAGKPCVAWCKRPAEGDRFRGHADKAQRPLGGEPTVRCRPRVTRRVETDRARDTTAGVLCGR